LYTNLAGVC